MPIRSGRESKILSRFFFDWAIENICHHLLDVTYHEDHNQVRDRLCVQNLTLVRKISGSRLIDRSQIGSNSLKRDLAGLSACFRMAGIALIFLKFHA